MTKEVKLKELDNEEFKVMDATFCYTRMKTPQKKYESEETEYTTSFVVNEDFAEDWEDRFPKASIKKVKTGEFSDKYGFDAPYPDQKKQFILKASVASHMKDKESGELVPVPYEYTMRPKVKQVVDGKIKDITMLGNVGNGSTGHLMFKEQSNKFGNFCYLRSLLITSLVEYNSSGSNNEWAEFGEVADEDGVTISDFDSGTEDVTVESPDMEDFDDDIPM